MGKVLPLDSVGFPTRWLLVFNLKAETWWSSLTACGRHKHVRAFGYVADTDAYIFFDPQLEHLTIQLARGNAARQLMAEWCGDADVLAMNTGQIVRMRWFMPLLCTTAVAHLVGLPVSALRPDALYRKCLQNGAIVVNGQAQHTDPPARPHAGAVDADCPATAGPSPSD
jgi:hypothetical protein